MESEVKTLKFSRLMLLSAISGIIAGLAMPGNILPGFLMWVCIVPMIFALKHTKTLFQAACAGWFFGFFLNGVTTAWMFVMQSLDWLGINDFLSRAAAGGTWFVISAYVGLFYALFALFSKFIFNATAPNFVKIPIIGLLYLLFTNNFLCFGDLAFPWAMIEYSQYKYISLIQICSLIKGSGLGFLIVMVNAYICMCMFPFDEKDNKFSFKPLHIITLFIFFACLFGYGKYSLGKEVTIPKLQIMVAQTNVKAKNRNHVKKLPARYVSSSQETKSKLIVFPEVSSIANIGVRNTDFMQALKDTALRDNKAIVAGIWDYSYGKNGEYFISNTAYLFAPSGAKKYVKAHLVPFGEFVPRWAIPKIIEELVFDKMLPNECERGKTVTVWDTPVGKVAPNICFEILFPKILKTQVQQGADIIVNMSNPSCFESDILKEQMYSFGVFRARENTRLLVASVNTGFSFIVAPDGRNIYTAEKNVEAFNDVDVSQFK